MNPDAAPRVDAALARCPTIHPLPDMQVSSARSVLVATVLGSWEGAPKAARDDFEKYIRGEANSFQASVPWARQSHLLLLLLLLLAAASF